LEQEKLTLDERVDNARYGYIVTRKEYYKELIDKMSDLSLQMNSKISNSHHLFENILKVNIDTSLLNDNLYNIIEEAVTIGGEKIARNV
jgi:hypothetical protein